MLPLSDHKLLFTSTRNRWLREVFFRVCMFVTDWVASDTVDLAISELFRHNQLGVVWALGHRWRLIEFELVGGSPFSLCKELRFPISFSTNSLVTISEYQASRSCMG